MATQSEKNLPSGGLKSLIFASVGVILLGLLLGFFGSPIVLQANLPKPEAQDGTSPEKPAEADAHGVAKETPEAADAGETKEVSHGPPSIVRMQPIVTNLSDTTDVWVRLEGSLLFDSKIEENPDIMAARLSQYVLAYLRSLKLSDLQGQGAVNAIVQDLNEITSSMSEGKVHGILISGLVFE